MLCYAKISVSSEFLEWGVGKDTYAKSATFIKIMVRLGSLAWRICHTSRAILEATALVDRVSIHSMHDHAGGRPGAYSMPTANTIEMPIFLRMGIFKSHTATSGIASIMRSDRTLIIEAVTRREYVSMHVLPGISFLLTH